MARTLLAQGDQMGSTIKIVISLLVIGSAAAYLIFSTMSSGDALSYFHTADEVIVKRPEFTGKKVRVGGYVEECSILQKTGTLEYRFEVRPDHPHNMTGVLKYPEAKGKTITVTYVGVVPDTFKDNAEITVGGTLQPDGTFAAQETPRSTRRKRRTSRRRSHPRRTATQSKRQRSR
jgi:cytochrome c-type biogenesis protein CcmE